MKKIEIPKKSGGKRTIYVQGPNEKRKFRLLGYKMASFFNKNGENIAHGFVEGRSPVSNAICHLNKKYTLSFDLKDFFDTVTPEHLKRAGVSEELAGQVCYEGSTKQGLSSSPSAANVAAIPLDKSIIQSFPPENDIIYTRYADDMCFSSDNINILLELRKKIPELTQNAGFKINEKKTRIQTSKFGRRIITGIAVDDKIYPLKKQRKKLRAIKHQLTKLYSFATIINITKQFLLFAVILEINRKKISQYIGLKEWCKLKTPTESLGGKLYTTMVSENTKKAFSKFQT